MKAALPHPGWRMALHWSSFALIAVGLAAILLRGAVDDRALRETLMQVHRNCGLLILALALPRLLAAPWLRSAAVAAGPLARWAARLAHTGIYGLLVAQPLAGWVLSSARGQHLSLFGVIPLPDLSARDRDLADSLHDLHEGLAWALLALVAAHIAAALWHHFLLRDDVLRAMLPTGHRRRERAVSTRT